MLRLAAMHLKNGLNETAAALFILYRFSTAHSLCDFKSSLLLQLEKRCIFTERLEIKWWFLKTAITDLVE